jgi:hypothetical protein
MKISNYMNDPESKRLQAIIRRMQTDDSVDAPEDAVKWARNVFRSRLAESRPTLVQRIKAVLRVDLAPGKAAFGERTAAAGNVRQMMFEAGGLAIDLRVKSGKRSVDIRGQVLGSESRTGKAVLFNDLVREEAPLDELGEFRFNGLAHGTYTFSLLITGTEVVIEDLRLAN